MSDSKFTIHDYISMIKKDEIIIPNFQREYTWGSDKVKRMVTSFFYKLKIGSFLFFQQNDSLESDKKEDILPFLKFDDDKTIYNNPESLKKGIYSSFYVIDGQQRLTSLMIAFTNYFDTSKKAHNSRERRRFYLRIGLENSLFGIDKFEFKKLTINGDIDYEDFVDNNIEYSHFSRKLNNDQEFYYIDLTFLFNPDEEKRLSLIGAEVDSLAHAAYKKQLNNITDTIEDKKIYLEKKEQLEKKRDVWSRQLTIFLDSILKQEIPYINVNTNLNEAIKTYQILNTSGIPLSELDILAASYSSKTLKYQVVQEDQEDYEVETKNLDRLYDRIKNGLCKSLDYNKIDVYNLINKAFNEHEKTKDQVPEWNFMKFMIDPSENPLTEVPNKVSEQLIKLIKYMSLKHSPNIYLNPSQVKNVNIFALSHYKSNEILKIPGDEIHKYIDEALECISWAGLFLQVRCGLKNMNRLNYYWQLFVIASLYYESKDNIYDNIDTLIAWYFLSRFSLRYRVDQNKHAMEDLEGLSLHFNDSKNRRYSNLEIMLNQIKFDNSKQDVALNDLSKNILITESEDIKDFYSKISDFICEFAVKDGYKTSIMIKDDNEYNVSTVLYPATGNTKYALEIHHIYPLDFAKKQGENTQKYRNKKKCYFNSPLNMCYISNSENSYISSRTLDQYFSDLDNSFIKKNHISKKEDLTKFLEERYNDFFSNLCEDIEKLLKL